MLGDSYLAIKFSVFIKKVVRISWRFIDSEFPFALSSTPEVKVSETIRNTEIDYHSMIKIETLQS